MTPRAFLRGRCRSMIAIRSSVYQIESRFERRMLNIIRQESGDSYAGLPAHRRAHCNLDKAFPDVRFPERNHWARLETEQQGRLEREKRQDELADKYEAETRRLDASEDRKHLSRAANRAVGVLVLLLVEGSD